MELVIHASELRPVDQVERTNLIVAWDEWNGSTAFSWRLSIVPPINVIQLQSRWSRDCFDFCDFATATACLSSLTSTRSTATLLVLHLQNYARGWYVHYIIFYLFISLLGLGEKSLID
ncbi:unnamed protein product [Coffea canephora]|uniref:Uncharacterized protein n=1 Tax=Coffea canephora TaxID=49390 RepID=A0A068USJ1_COFCA|nr:unnamed protein product [Coffea canephora]